MNFNFLIFDRNELNIEEGDISNFWKPESFKEWRFFKNLFYHLIFDDRFYILWVEYYFYAISIVLYLILSTFLFIAWIVRKVWMVLKFTYLLILILINKIPKIKKQ